MKKSKIVIFIILGALLISVFAIISSEFLSPMLAFVVDSFKKEKEKSPIFECDAMTIELTKDFECYYKSSGHDYQLVSEDYEIFIDYVTITSQMPAGGFSLADLEEFMEQYVPRFLNARPDRIEVYEEDGILYYDADANNDGKIDRLFAMYKYQDTFWIVIFRPIYSSFEESKDQFMAWSKNVSFPEE